MSIKFIPKAVFFDFDGTLIEFERDFLYDQTDRILKILGHPPIDREHLEETFSEFDFFRFVHPEHHPLDDFMERFWSHYEWNTFPNPRAIQGAPDLLAALHGWQVPAGIVTARLVPVEDVWLDLKRIGCESLIKHVVTRPSKEVDWQDKRDTIKSACEALAVDPADVIFVGDIPPDIISARAAGIGCAVAVASGGIKREILAAAAPDLLLEGVHELLAALRPQF